MTSSWREKIESIERSTADASVSEIVAALRSAEADIRGSSGERFAEAAKMIPPAHSSNRLCSDESAAAAVLACCAGLAGARGEDELTRRGREWAHRAIAKSLRPQPSRSAELDLLVGDLGISRESLLRDALDSAEQLPPHPPPFRRRKPSSAPPAAEIDSEFGPLCLACRDDPTSLVPLVDSSPLCAALSASVSEWRRFLSIVGDLLSRTSSPSVRRALSAVSFRVMSATAASTSSDPLPRLFDSPLLVSVARSLSSMPSFDPSDACDPARRKSRSAELCRAVSVIRANLLDRDLWLLCSGIFGHWISFAVMALSAPRIPSESTESSLLTFVAWSLVPPLQASPVLLLQDVRSSISDCFVGDDPGAPLSVECLPEVVRLKVSLFRCLFCAKSSEAPKAVVCKAISVLNFSRSRVVAEVKQFHCDVRSCCEMHRAMANSALEAIS